MHAHSPQTGVEWSLNVAKAEHMNDTYLADHAVFSATGIEMERFGNKYRFQSVGDGTVTLELLFI